MAIVFGLENLTFLAKCHIFIPKCTEGDGGGGGGATGLGNVPRKYFLLLPSVYLEIQMSLFAKKVGFSRAKTMATKISHKV